MTPLQRMALSFARAQNLPPGDHVLYLHPLAAWVKKAEGERWITLHPSHNPEHYVRVLIRQNKDGSAHVLSGGEGLRGLKLNRLRRPEAWQGSRVRRSQNLSPEAQATREQALEAVRSRRLKQARLARELGLAGWGEEAERALSGARADELRARAGNAPGAKGGAAMVAAGEARAVSTALKALERNLVRELVENHELRAAVTGEALALPPDPPRSGLGFRKNLRAAAEASGLNAETVAQRRDALLQERIAALRSEDPEKAARVEGAAALMGEMHEVAKALRNQGTLGQLGSQINPAQVRERADKVREFLRLAQESKELERRALNPERYPQALRRVLLNQDPSEVDVEARLLEDQDFIQRLQHDVQELARQDLTRSFLEKVEAVGEGSLGQAREKMRNTYAFGAHTHLLSALSTLHMGMDRNVTEVFGLSGAAQIAARALAARLEPEALEAVREGLSRYQDTESAQAMQRALEGAERAEAAAAEIELPTVHDAASLAAARELNALRQGYLEEALHNLGATLGQVEAGAALNLALRHAGKGPLRLSLGRVPSETALWGLGGLGLREGEDFNLSRTADNELQLRLEDSALDKLVSRASAAEELTRARLEAIRRGDLDQPDWLPVGFTRYPKTIHNDPVRPQPFALPPGFGQKPAPAALQEYVASRLADGWKPSDILREVGSVDFVQQYVPEAQHEAYAEALEQLFPSTNAQGELRDVDTDPELAHRYQQLAEGFAREHHGAAAPLHAQSIGEGQPVRKALYLALVQDPRSQAAFKALGDLSEADQKALRNYFYTEIAQVDPTSGRDKAALEARLKELGPEPPKMGPDLFGGESITPEWEAWNQKRQAALEAFAGPTAWAGFVDGMRGLKNACLAIQNHMRSRFVTRFAALHANLTGQPLRIGKEAIAHGERFAAAVDPAERARLLAREQAQLAELRERQAGRFAAEGEGAVKEKLNRALELKRKLEQAQGALFMGLGASGYETQAGVRVEDPFRERYTLGSRAEGEVAALLPYVSQNLPPTASGIHIFPELTMGKGTKYAPQQRAIKFAVAAGKSYQALGMGSGKTAVQIGTFTELHAQQRARRGLFLVPSVVRDQFGEEMARYVEPGRYRFHAKDGAYVERLEHYRNPDTHMLVVTHQTARDDLLKMMATHEGLDLEDLRGVFMAAAPKVRRRMVREALKAHGAEALLDYVAVDEGHNLSNRAGKPDAVAAAVADALLHESQQALLASGTPAKNDPSEIYDALYKLDPERYEGRYPEFQRNYGLDLPAAKEAFKREARRRFFSSKVASGTTRTDVWGQRGQDGVDRPIPLHPEQAKGLERVNAAYEAARTAQKEGRSEVQALRILSPTGDPHRLMGSLSTLRFAAQARVLDAAPAEHNAKLQHLLQLAEAQRARGQPGVVFAHSLAAVQQIERALKAAGHRVVSITGMDSAKSKAQKRLAFHPDQGEPSADILVASDAGAVGMNLQRGRWLANYDLPMTHATLAQRNARIDRLGQRNPVEIHHLVTDSEYDRQAVARLARKSELQQVLEGDWESLDDTGLSAYIAQARAERATVPETVGV